MTWTLLILGRIKRGIFFHLMWNVSHNYNNALLYYPKLLLYFLQSLSLGQFRIILCAGPPPFQTPSKFITMPSNLCWFDWNEKKPKFTWKINFLIGNIRKMLNNNNNNNNNIVYMHAGEACWLMLKRKGTKTPENTSHSTNFPTAHRILSNLLRPPQKCLT